MNKLKQTHNEIMAKAYIEFTLKKCIIYLRTKLLS
jgi:hypothetical protein